MKNKFLRQSQQNYSCTCVVPSMCKKCHPNRIHVYPKTWQLSRLLLVTCNSQVQSTGISCDYHLRNKQQKPSTGEYTGEYTVNKWVERWARGLVGKLEFNQETLHYTKPGTGKLSGGIRLDYIWHANSNKRPELPQAEMYSCSPLAEYFKINDNKWEKRDKAT